MPIPVEYVNGKKTFTVLENNPEVMNELASKLGLSPRLQFHDVYSLTDPELLGMIPRPCLALLVITPLTPAWHAERSSEDMEKPMYAGAGTDEPIWFKQTLGHACGSIGLLHSVINGPAKEHILPNSTLSKIREGAIPLKWEERAQFLYDNKDFEKAHQSVAEVGDTIPPDASGGDKLGQHFVSFVKTEDGMLWELEGSRKGPIERGALNEDEDVLSERAVQLGLGRIIELEKQNGGKDLRFSCIALSETT
ncbi:hypothetical protein BJ875DRAFT_547247 [Amylocarpus encephaloides]|uniref:Ubiquitin carboxyl-terminal hydrolase n=1 Tax=Amylocarpus encephaloides TaxID=45428 RepID=A0A9P7Y8G5_9HELO|nr:hypothetical protein BJ875DRAFT_547247 [Amylocarpus encephaloides]